MRTPKPCTHGSMALDAATQVRRIKAAIALAGMTQQEFSDEIEKLGVDKSALGRMVRADSPNPPPNIPPMTFAIAQSMGKVAGLPPEWFTEPDLTQLFARSGRSEQARELASLAWAVSDQLRRPTSSALDDLLQRWRSNGLLPPEDPDAGLDL